MDQRNKKIQDYKRRIAYFKLQHKQMLRKPSKTEIDYLRLLMKRLKDLEKAGQQDGMKIPICSGPAGLDKFADECAKKLFSGIKHQFFFPNEGSHNEQLDNAQILGGLRNQANVYAIFVRNKKSEKESDWEKMYVGQRKCSGIRERITQHLIKKHSKTGSMLKKVKKAVLKGKEVGLSFIKVEPEPLRLFVEETIIAKHNNKYKKDLPWNTHG
ncbi:MAG: hypothetical protein IT395_00035 [Candidatus Omnitrophica bacterium]|nr:hypothetical protein [Candidatus Omnitrophota bacterium]